MGGCEVTKNLVLAGIKELRMVDAKNVSEEDSTSQFLAPRDEVGKNRAEASLARVQQLNPMVEVTADPASSEEKDADFFKKFDVFGFFGFSFMDLVSHNFVEEVTTLSPVAMTASLLP